jgi:hypothetical protein
MLTTLIILAIYAYCRMRIKEKYDRIREVTRTHSLVYVERRKAS